MHAHTSFKEIQIVFTVITARMKKTVFSAGREKGAYKGKLLLPTKRLVEIYQKKIDP